MVTIANDSEREILCAQKTFLFADRSSCLFTYSPKEFFGLERTKDPLDARKILPVGDLSFFSNQLWTLPYLSYLAVSLRERLGISKSYRNEIKGKRVHTLCLLNTIHSNRYTN